MGVNKKVVSAIIVCILTLILCFITVGQFVLFLSSHTSLKHIYKYNADSHKNIEKEGSIMIPIIQNIILLGIFVIQHSLQANSRVKTFLYHKGFAVVERLLYNCGSCIALQLVMYFWQSIPSMTVWEISTSDHVVFWWFFSTVHFVAWLITYSGCFIMDLTELLGLKQVYHYILNWPDPLHQKSEGLKRVYAHMRHPSFSALIAILFIHPVMQIDRFLLAYTFTIYMITRFKVDDIDYAYQRRMLHRKYRDLCLND